MKKLIFMGAAAMLALSCSSDDDGGNVSVEGTWKLTKFEITEGIDFNNDGTASTNLRLETGCFNNSSVIFSDDNEVTFSMESIDVEPQEVEGGFDYTVDCSAPNSSSGTYTVANNAVTINTGGDPVAFTRNGNKLTFAIPESITVPIEQDGEIVQTELGAYIEFTKQ